MALTHIGTLTGSGNPSSLSFTGIPATFASLILKGAAYTGSAAGPVDGLINFNSDSGSNKDANQGGRYNAANYAFQQVNQTAAVFGYIPGTSQASPGPLVCQIDMDIVAYRKVVDQPGNCGWQSQSNYMYTNSPAKEAQFLFTGWYDGDNTVDITTLTFTLSSGTWGTETRFDLYGRSDS